MVTAGIRMFLKPKPGGKHHEEYQTYPKSGDGTHDQAYPLDDAIRKPTMPWNIPITQPP
jgi:hypothetical protein